MRKRLRYMYKSKMAALVAAVILIAGISGMAAYLTAADTEENLVTLADNTIALVEEFTPPAELQPGVSFTKDVSVMNTGTGKCFVRVKAVFSSSDIGKYCTVDWPDESDPSWVYNEADGYWYYTKVLAQGEQTSSLFTMITLSEETPESVIQDFDMIVYAESYQNNNYTNYTDAWENYQKNLPTSQAVGSS